MDIGLNTSFDNANIYLFTPITVSSKKRSSYFDLLFHGYGENI